MGLIRFVVWIALLLIGWSFVRSVARSVLGAPGPGRPQARPPAERPPETLVRDRVCGTYVPRAGALRLVDDRGREHFFCSEACRRRHLAEASPPA